MNSTIKRCALAALAATLAAGLTLPAAAPAATAAPAWRIESFAAATNFDPTHNIACNNNSGFCNSYLVTATNAGSEPTNGSEITLTDTLPAGLSVREVGAIGLGAFTCEPPEPLAEPLEVSCTLAAGEVLQPDQTLQARIFLSVDEPATEGQPLTNLAGVSGGGAPPASTESRNQISATLPPFGFSDFDNYLADAAGEAETRAGSHPYEQTTTIGLDHVFRKLPNAVGKEDFTSVHDPRDIVVDLPPGLAGSALSAPTCPMSKLSAEGAAACPPDTVVGHLETEPGGATSIDSPLWNITPEAGVAAEFGYRDALNASHVLYASVAPGPEGYGLRTTSPEIPQIALKRIVVNIFGDPAQRDEASGSHVPTFTSPANCDGRPLLTHIHMDSWQAPGARNSDGSPNFADPNWASATSASDPVTGCNQLQFHPTITATPETNRADSPTGLDVNLRVPQAEGVNTLGTPPLKRAVVTLPEGMSVNPSSANGLQGCSLSDLGMSASGEPNSAPPTCPNASKIGALELETPALPGKVLEGEIYVAQQSANPFNSLLALYLVVDDPTTGVIVKIPGEIKADPSTGQLSTIVDNSPQFPFSELRTHFFGGTKAALRTPAVCGKYSVTSSLTPWSAPESGPPATPSASFQITQSANGEPCPQTQATRPNKPAFSAGTLSPTAGAFSPFVLKLSREDGSQELSGLSLTLPPGLIGKLAGLTECSEAQLNAAKGREALGQGAAEIASPSCPASSEVGTVTVGAGAGLTPYYATGHVYLAGPYKSAPLSLAVITPAVAGPFDLGSVLIRNALQVNPETAQITAVSDPIPHILQGIPLDIRSIALKMNRPNFTLNPTNCEPFAVTGAASTVLGQSAPLSNPFQVGGCNALAFKPKLALKLKGGTKRNKNPALTATLTYPKKGAYANIASAQVTLPHSAFLDQAHIGTVCTRVQFAAHACPAASVYGHATATTPLLDQPLSGPVYLRSSSNKLPDLVADLNGQIEVTLDGKVDTGKGGGIRNTFQLVPDAPVSKFVLSLQGGKQGLLVNSENLCGPHAKTKAIADFTGQNGKVYDTEPVVQNSCKKKGGKGKRSKHASHRLGTSHR